MDRLGTNRDDAPPSVIEKAGIRCQLFSIDRQVSQQVTTIYQFWIFLQISDVSPDIGTETMADQVNGVLPRD